MESKKIDEIGQVARTTHEKWIQHAVGYSRQDAQKATYTWMKIFFLQKEDLGILTGFNWFFIRFNEWQQTYIWGPRWHSG